MYISLRGLLGGGGHALEGGRHALEGGRHALEGGGEQSGFASMTRSMSIDRELNTGLFLGTDIMCKYTCVRVCVCACVCIPLWSYT